MAEGKKSFLLYADQWIIVQKLSKEQRGELLSLLYMYVNDQDPRDPDDLALLITYETIRQSLKRDLKKWDITKAEKSNGGKSGNLKRYRQDLYELVLSGKMDIDVAIAQMKLDTNRKGSHTDDMGSHRIASLAVSDSDSVNDNDNVSVSGSDSKRPTTTEIENLFLLNNKNKIPLEQVARAAVKFYNEGYWDKIKNWEKSALKWFDGQQPDKPVAKGGGVSSKVPKKL